MYETPTIVFMNQSQTVVAWFMRGPSMARAEELGYDIRINERDEKLEPEEWAQIIADADALLTTWGSPKLDETVLARNDSLKIVGHVGGSVATHVTDTLFSRGVRVCTANPLMARSVAESGLMLMLMGLRRAHMHVKLGTRSEDMVWGKDWEIRPAQDCRIGIWGYGDIAAWLVKLLRPFGPQEILVASNHLSEEDAQSEGMSKVEFDDLFEQSDVIFCVTGMTVANEGRVGPKQLEAIKDGALLINLGRAPLIQPEALIEELQKGRFTGIFDVYEKEPLPEDDPLNNLPNVILQPHNAGTGRDARYMAAMLDEFDRFFRGEELQYEVHESRARMMTNMEAVRKHQA